LWEKCPDTAWREVGSKIQKRSLPDKISARLMFSGANDQADATRRTLLGKHHFCFCQPAHQSADHIHQRHDRVSRGGHVASDNKESGGDGITVKDEVRHEMRILVRGIRIAGITYAEAAAAFRRQFLFEILNCNGWNQCKAAKALGVHRNTIGHMLDELGIDTKVKTLSSAKASFPENLVSTSVVKTSSSSEGKRDCAQTAALSKMH